jgi:hypothetical protein
LIATRNPQRRQVVSLHERNDSEYETARTYEHYTDLHHWTLNGMIGMKSFIEVVLYAHPMWLRVTNNFPAFITDALVLICSIPIYTILEPHSSKECKTEA